jgi:ElaB/YqjD/DUF883 family membrane-anchored ribosome-binding protein
MGEIDPASIHSPFTLINLFANALNPKDSGKILFIKGKYSGNGRKNYGGYFFDALREETSTHSLTLKIHENLRPTLQEDRLYLFKGILERKINDSGNISLTFAVSELLSEERSAVSEEQVRRAELITQKSRLRSTDVGSLLKEKLANSVPPDLLIIYGSTGIVDQDVKTAAGNTLDYYRIDERRVNLSRKGEIIAALKGIQIDSYDAVAIVRGGGSGLEMFDDPEIGEAILGMRVPFISAIGHATDTTLAQQLADKHFTTPTAFGIFLKGLYESVMEENNHSKLQVADLEIRYREQIQSLQDSYQQLQAQHQKASQQLLQIQSENYQLQRSASEMDQVRNGYQQKMQEKLDQYHVDNQKLQKQVAAATKMITQQRYYVIGVAVISLVVGLILGILL